MTDATERRALVEELYRCLPRITPQQRPFPTLDEFARKLADKSLAELDELLSGAHHLIHRQNRAEARQAIAAHKGAHRT